MILMFSVLWALLFILSGTAAVVHHNNLRKSRRRQARSLSLALTASESYRQYVRHRESDGVAQRQQRLVPGIALMNIGSEV
jgi:hypothetical protein